MFIYIPDWVMYYVVDSFRYDKEKEEVIICICHFRMEIIIHNVNRGMYFRIRRSILNDYYFELSKAYDWSLKLI